MSWVQRLTKWWSTSSERYKIYTFLLHCSYTKQEKATVLHKVKEDEEWWVNEFVKEFKLEKREQEDEQEEDEDNQQDEQEDD